MPKAAPKRPWAFKPGTYFVRCVSHPGMSKEELALDANYGKPYGPHTFKDKDAFLKHIAEGWNEGDCLELTGVLHAPVHVHLTLSF